MSRVGLLVAMLVLELTAAGQTTRTVQFDIDAKRNVRPISPYIYGVNQFRLVLDGMDGPWSNLCFTRMGGNRLTAYNWTNNASNAGSDWHFQSDDYLVMRDYAPWATLPGGATIPVIEAARKRNAVALLTIPIAGLVAADKETQPFDDVRKAPDFLKTRFKSSQPRKGAPFTTEPDPNAPVVYQDEFVNWVKTKYPDAFTDPKRAIWFSMDNEPDWWSHTHSHIRPDPTTYAELVEKTIAYAGAVKDVAPQALIFGPVNYGWQGFVRLQNAPDAQDRDFHTFYLRQMAEAEKRTGRRLIDVFDVHWYPEARGDGVRVMGNESNNSPAVAAARMQAPRSLWDPKYVEDSWITKDSIKGEPIDLITRLETKIADYYPGTKLAITEYDFGGGDHISGAIAQADVLGIFGRRGVFAAALWPGRDIPFTGAAFEMYRNFDGQNGTFGDTSIHAQTSDIENTSVYASLDSANPNRLTIIAINKTDQPIMARISFKNAPKLAGGLVYQLTGESPKPRATGRAGDLASGDFIYTMPPLSVSTLVWN